MNLKFLPIIMLLIVPTANAGSTIMQFLSAYIPNSTIANFTLYNTTLNGNSYIIMEHGASFIVVEYMPKSSNYSFVTNSSQIYKIIRPFVISEYMPKSSTLSMLNSTMNEFQSQAAPPLNDCRLETGLNLYTCNVSNACFSCQTVPICSDWLPYYGGPTGVMGLGIMNFSAQYDNLVANYTMFHSSIESLLRSNQANPYYYISELKSSLNNIAYLSAKIPQNPLFPLPQNFTASQFASCSSYLLPTQEPWYCVDIGMCKYTTFNSILLSNMQSIVGNLSSLPLSNASIMSISENASKLALSYFLPVQYAKEKSAYEQFINSTMPLYNSTLSNAESLLSKVSNSSLSASISRLESTMQGIKNLGINQSISLANVEINSAISNVSALYSKIFIAYNALNSSVANATGKALLYQLDFAQVPPGLAKLSAEQQALQASLLQGINSTSIAYLQNQEALLSKNLSAYAYTPFSMAVLVKNLDGGIVSSMLYSAEGNVIKEINSAPAYAALISFIIGLILLLFIYSLTYARLKKRKKIRISKSVKRAWGILFLLLFIIVLIYTYATYVYASSASTFLPVSLFISKLQGSGSAAIMINSNNAINVSQLLCAETLQRALTAQGKKVAVFVAENYSCMTTNSSLSGAKCFNKLLASGLPVIYINEGNSSISYKGLYGNMLTAQGSATYGSDCELAKIIK
ncbi:MAG: hypothetical protein ACP5K5_03885 [Candidatus Micrarchaeia archaeon]